MRVEEGKPRNLPLPLGRQSLAVEEEHESPSAFLRSRPFPATSHPHSQEARALAELPVAPLLPEVGQAQLRSSEEQL